MCAVGNGRWGLLWLLCLCAPLQQAVAADAGGASHLGRQDLIGVWRLVRIEYAGSHGAIGDPFYQPESTGVIIYDASGWMSVYIAAPQRQAWEVPPSRTPPTGKSPDAQLKAAAFDTYYTYFGTWDFDEASSVVTHHVKSALIPAETGLDYAQRVTLENGRMVFTVRGGGKGEETVRRKVWERVTDR